MKTAELFKEKTVLSFEVFPPKRTSPIDSIYTTIQGLAALNPDFISVTYGAGGNRDKADTIDIASFIKREYGIESIAHLTGLYLTERDALDILRRMRGEGIENVLALRGDLIDGMDPAGDFRYASELISFMRDNGDFNILAACYPEGHSESGGLADDITYLKQKVDAGAEHFISQMFFDNDYFYRLQELTWVAGIRVPIQAGIMPVVNKRQIEHIASLCGATLPSKYLKMMQRYEHSPQAMLDAGIAYAVNQITDLLTQGVQGIHLYTMNRPDIAARISNAVSSLFAC